MGIMMIAGGPIDEYLRLTGKDIKTFDTEIKRGDTNATSIFASEMIYKAVSNLIETVENIEFKNES
jgi:hypothetical protein